MLQLRHVSKKARAKPKNPNLESEFGTLVRARRHGLGLTQEELAWRADMHRTYIADIERGGRNLTLRSIAALAKALESSIAALMPKGGSRDAAPTLVEILLIEDSASEGELLARSLSRANVSNPIRITHDGVEALDYLFGTGRYAKKKPGLPGLILLDLQLPRGAGVDVLARIKAEKRAKNIPVVVMTSSYDDCGISECGRLGVENYILKPVTFENLSAEATKVNLRWALLHPDQARDHDRK